MKPVPHPANETARLKALEAYGILDTKANPAFDALTRAASLLCGAPIALVSLIDHDRQWFKSVQGLAGVTETPRDIAFCTHAILEPALFEIPQALDDPRFRDNPLVTGAPGIRYYAGAPLVDAQGLALGTLCVIDRQPRRLTDAQREGLVEISKAVVRLIELERAEEALRESEQRFKGAFQSAAHGIALVSPAGRFLAANAALCRMMGYDEAELVATDFQAVTHPQDLEADLALMHALLDGEIDTYSIEKRYFRKGGGIVWAVLSVSLVRAANGEPLHFVSQIQDITQRRVQEQELLRAKERLSLATESGNIGIWDWSIVGDKLIWDERMYRLYGLEPQQGPASYDLWLRHVHPDDRAGVEAVINRALTDAKPFETHYRIVWPDGSVRHIRELGRAILDASGRAIRMLGTNWDATAPAQRAEELLVARREADAANRAKSLFLASMSHEIRTPMNGVIGFADLLLDTDLTDEQRGHLTLLRDASRSLLALINDILDISKIEAGKLDLERIAMRPASVIEGAVGTVRAQVEAKGLHLGLELDPAVPEWIAGDPTRLRQILLNLLSNALKFTAAGQIGVRCRVTTNHTGRRLHFDVIDTGIGIPADRRHLLFQDFSQIDQSTTRNFGGTGLGLSICRRLVEAMGGEIGVLSEPGAGSNFWFAIPLIEAGAVELEAEPASTREDALPARILVAEDIRMNQILIEAVLKGEGHHVTLVGNGAEAVAAVQAGDFDLILMDMEMPEMDGIAATRAIRALPATVSAIPIIALTANAMLDKAEECTAAGMDGFLSKPIDRAQLATTLRSWLASPTRARAGRPASRPDAA